MQALRVVATRSLKRYENYGDLGYPMRSSRQGQFV